MMGKAGMLSIMAAIIPVYSRPIYSPLGYKIASISCEMKGSKVKRKREEERGRSDERNRRPKRSVDLAMA
jgi:hypothetical protein